MILNPKLIVGAVVIEVSKDFIVRLAYVFRIPPVRPNKPFRESRLPSLQCDVSRTHYSLTYIILNWQRVSQLSCTSIRGECLDKLASELTKQWARCQGVSCGIFAVLLAVYALNTSAMAYYLIVSICVYLDALSILPGNVIGVS